MKKMLVSASLAASLLAVANMPATAHITVMQGEEVTIKTTELRGGVYMLEGRGGNIGVSVGDDGVFMIDDQFANLADKIAAAVAEVTDEPVAYVLNTHWHGDHTGGNAAFAGKGATVLSHDNVRARLKDAGKDGLPVLTFSDTTTFYWNDHEIHVFHLPNAHTDGDAIVHFRDLNIIHTGDIMFSGLYPFIDLKSGGSVDGYIDSLKAILDLTDEETKVIPGHGPLSGRTEVEETIEMLKGARAVVKALHDKGMSEDEIVAADPLAPWNETYSWRFINAERMTRTFVQDLAQN